ncbi:MAG TPA: hypothetical protein ENG66_01000 [Thermococcus sp.]|mgnify:CR=1 FL=1|nr:hypothetical protein [Thermococcus sp.]
MSGFGYGENPEILRSLKWIDATNKAFKHHVVRMAIGTADACEYLHSANDLIFGVLQDEGTLNNWVVVACGGVAKVICSKAGTVNKGDPVIYDHANSGGTVGKVRSAFVSGEHVSGTAAGYASLSYKAVPGSVKKASGTGTPIYLTAEGTSVYFSGAYDCTLAYQIDQPVIGYALEDATTPNQEFRVLIARERHIKNSSVV